MPDGWDASDAIVAVPGVLDFGVLPWGDSATLTAMLRPSASEPPSVRNLSVETDIPVSMAPAPDGDGYLLTVTVHEADGKSELHGLLEIRYEEPFRRCYLPIRACWSDEAAKGSQANGPSLTPGAYNTISTLRHSPAAQLSGNFVAHSLQESGQSLKRVGYGWILRILPVGDDHVILISTAGAALIDLANGQAQWTIDCPALDGAISEDGSRLVLLSPRQLTIWNLHNGQEEYSLASSLYPYFGDLSPSSEPLRSHYPRIVFLADGNSVIFQRHDRPWIWEFTRGKSERRLKEPRNSSAISVYGKRLSEHKSILGIQVISIWDDVRFVVRMLLGRTSNENIGDRVLRSGVWSWGIIEHPGGDLMSSVVGGGFDERARERSHVRIWSVKDGTLAGELFGAPYLLNRAGKAGRVSDGVLAAGRCVLE